MKIDHHLHTSRYSPDSEIDPIKLVKHASKIGLDGLVITEHDYQWEPDELAELADRAAPLVVFSGAEISAREGHFLVYGLPTIDEAPPGIALADLLKVVRSHHAAIVAAHPFRWDQPLRSNCRRAWPGLRCPGTGEQQRDQGNSFQDRAPAPRPSVHGSDRLKRRSRTPRPGLLFHRV